MESKKSDNTHRNLPAIVAFCCDQSGYPAADMVGTLRLKLPPSLEVIRVPCAGRIATSHLLKALENGADGVLIFACHEGNCQYLEGNIRAKERVAYAHRMMDVIGLERERLELVNVATNSGAKFAQVVNAKVQELRELGPNPVKVIRTSGGG